MLKINKRFKKQEIVRRTPLRVPLYLSIVVFLGCLVGRLYCSNNLAVKNDELKDLRTRKAQLQKDVIRLEYESSLLSSLTKVEERAKNMGFVPIEEPLVLIDIEGTYKFATATNSSADN